MGKFMLPVESFKVGLCDALMLQVERLWVANPLINGERVQRLRTNWSVCCWNTRVKVIMA
jgi:hypothetical protein